MQNWLERRHRTESECEVFGPTISVSRLSHARPAPTAVTLLSASDPPWCSIMQSPHLGSLCFQNTCGPPFDDPVGLSCRAASFGILRNPHAPR